MNSEEKYNHVNKMVKNTFNILPWNHRHLSKIAQVYFDDKFSDLFNQVNRKSKDIKINKNHSEILKKNFPNARFNLDMNHDGFNHQLNTILSEPYFKNQSEEFKEFIKKPNKIYFSGEMFTEYVDNNPFAHHFPEIFKIFSEQSAYDLWFNLPLEEGLLDGYYSPYILRSRPNPLHSKAFNIRLYPLNCNPSFYFDYDCCKISYDYYNKTYLIDQTLIFPYMRCRLPSFITKSDRVRVREEKCLCRFYKRTLKCFFKGFFNNENLNSEIRYATNFFSNYRRRCEFCHINVNDSVSSPNLWIM